MIFTFYSFKGGVGRSMALANVAEAFYLAKLRVVMIDWDLEAPGLESYFFRSPGGIPDPALLSARSSPGMLDFMYQHQQGGEDRWLSEPAAAEDEEEEPLSPLRAQLRELRLKKRGSANPVLGLRDLLFPIHAPAPDHPTGPGLWLIPAGRRGPDGFSEYARRVQQFDWSRFWEEHGGKQFFDSLSRNLLEFADVVLIDSRTGVTEMGGVCARIMADAVVAMAAPNFQNLDGVARIVRSFDDRELEKLRDGRKLPVLVVPSRVDEGKEIERFGEYKKLFETVIEQKMAIPDCLSRKESPFFSLRIPYLTYFSYLEERVLGPDLTEVAGAEALISSYRRLTARMAALAPERSRLREAFIGEISKELPEFVLRPTVLLSHIGEHGESDANEAAHLLSEAGFQILPRLAHRPENAQWKERIDSAGAILFFLDPESKRDAQLREEAIYARRSGKHVLTILSGGLTSSEVPLWAHHVPVETSYDLPHLAGKLYPPPSTQKLPFLAPPAFAKGVERADWEALILAHIGSIAGAFGIGGPAGIGKTWLASKIAASAAAGEMFPQGIFWLTPDEKNLEPSFREILSALDGPEAAKRATDPKFEVAFRLKSARCLLVLDDVSDAAALQTFLDAIPAGVCLFTTRNRDLLPTSNAVEVPPLRQAEGEALLQSLGMPLTAALAKALEGSPLIVTAVAKGLLSLDAAARDGIAKELEEKLPAEGIRAFPPFGLGQVASVIVMAAQKMLAPLKSQTREQIHSASYDKETSEALRRCFLLDASGALTPVVRMYAGLRQPVPKREQKLAAGEARKQSEEVKQARRLLTLASPDLKTLVELAGILRGYQYWDLAGGLYAKAVAHPDAGLNRERYAQRLAHVTYNNLDLPADQRFDAALKILRDYCRLEQILHGGENSLPGDKTAREREIETRQETFGLAGAIYKRRWEYDNRIENLEHSANYYQAGAALGVESQDGYTAINAAFVLDLLAATLERDPEPGPQGKLRISSLLQEVRSLRDELILKLGNLAQQPFSSGKSPQDYAWLYASLGEAYFGRAAEQPADYDFALLWLREAARWLSGWQYQTLARQLARLTNLAEDRDKGAEAVRTLKSFLQGDSVAAENLRRGKIGLALSGGGFRASIFHIGVLARLAELDLLRHVDVLSCVSGGSIIGAQYYLELQTLLQNKVDAEICRKDYLEIVERLETRFVKGVEGNLRIRVASNPFKNFLSAFSSKYSRTARLGELYESELFARAEGWKGHGKFYMDDLVVKPKDGGDFNPKYDNWRRSNKIPIVLFNAATVNTGHNWQFAATWMGEPSYLIDSSIDAAEQFPRVYYWEAPKDYERIRLGVAVGASSCVPALFEPVRLPGLYEGFNIQLVDGGVHDNQGTAGLLEQECSVIIVSDASGQMGGVRDAKVGMLNALGRARNILETRVRDSQFRALGERLRSGLLRQLVFLHLKKDLHAGETSSGLTSYQVSRKTQELLASVRTDLDAFHQQEAGALMVSGYRMACRELEPLVPTLLRSEAMDAAASQWKFLEADSLVNGSATVENVGDFRHLLSIGGSVGGKLWKLAPWVMVPLTALWVAFFVVLMQSARVVQWRAVVASHLPPKLLPYLTWYSLAGGVLLAALLWKGLLHVANRGWKSYSQILMGVLLTGVGWIVALWYLLFLNPLYLALGKLPQSRGPSKGFAWVAIILLQLAPAWLVERQIQRWWSTGTNLTDLAHARSARGQQCPDPHFCSDDGLRIVVAAWTKVLDEKADDNTTQEALRGRSWAYRDLGEWALALADLDRLTTPLAQDQLDSAYCLKNLGQNDAGFWIAAINRYTRVINSPTSPSDLKLVALKERFFLNWEIYARKRRDLNTDPNDLKDLQQKLQDDGGRLGASLPVSEFNTVVARLLRVVNADIAEPPIAPKVFVQVENAREQGPAESLFDRLSKNKFSPQGIQLVPGGPHSVVRYFDSRDKWLADALVALVKTQFLIDVGDPVMSSASSLRTRGSLELYLAENANLPGSTSSSNATLLTIAVTDNQLQLLNLLRRSEIAGGVRWMVSRSPTAIPPPEPQLRYTFDGSETQAQQIANELQQAGFPAIRLVNLNKSAPGKFEVRPGVFEFWLAADTQVPGNSNIR
jgi:predicted acylesterase/phospholipase RssA/cellulose biosynthesis protein BcsQ